LNATSASYAVSASNATNAVTASFANAFTVANTLTATTLVVQTVSSSVIYSSGSNVFGNNIANTQVFTGSMLVTGSITATEGNFLGSGVDGSLGSVVRISTTNTNGNARNWALVNTFDSYGDLNFRLSTAQGGNALVSGSTVLTLSRTGTAAFSNTVDVAVNVSNSTSGLNLVNNFGSGYGNSLNFYQSTTKYAFIQVESSVANTSEMAFKTMISSTVATRMFINSAGNVGIGTTSPTGLGGKAFVVSAVSTYPEIIWERTGDGARKWGTLIGSDGSLLCRDYTSGNNVFNINPGAPNASLSISSAGWIYMPSITDGAGTYALKWRSGGLLSFDTSSARYKDNIRDSVYGLSDIMKLRSAMFEYKKELRTDIGLIAEEVYEVIPELVTLDDEGLPNAVAYDRFVSVLTKAIQELKSENDTLKEILQRNNIQ
jgi:hypothetical protein